jgi:pilus assembly protein Flp/PilA
LPQTNLPIHAICTPFGIFRKTLPLTRNIVLTNPPEWRYKSRQARDAAMANRHLLSSEPLACGDPAGPLTPHKEVNDMTMKQKLIAFLRDEEGLTTVEYAVAGGLIALLVILAFTALGGTVQEIICQINGRLVEGSGVVGGLGCEAAGG